MTKLIKGLKIGHAQNIKARTGLSVFLFDQAYLSVAQIDGSAPATANFSSLDPSHGLNQAHAILFTGGSLFGLNSVSGVMDYLIKKNIGLKLNSITIPIVPACAIFDLTVGACDIFPDEQMAQEACLKASDNLPDTGMVGCGTGSSIGKFCGLDNSSHGGFGYSYVKYEKTGLEVWTFVVVNAMGDVINPQNNRVIAGTKVSQNDPKLIDIRNVFNSDSHVVRQMNKASYTDIEKSMNSIAQNNSSSSIQNTTLILNVTNASLDTSQAEKMAKACHHGLASCVIPSHTTFDGDLAISTSVGDVLADINLLTYLASQTTIEAIINAVEPRS